MGPCQVFWAIQDLSHSHSHMPPPDNIGSAFVKMAKIAVSEPAKWAVAVTIPAFCLVAGLVHPQEIPTNCYWGALSLLALLGLPAQADTLT